MFFCFYFLVAIRSVVHNITRPVFESRPIKMHNLVELWALLALFLSKIFDQVGDSVYDRMMADVGLFNFEGWELGLNCQNF